MTTNRALICLALLLVSGRPARAVTAADLTGVTGVRGGLLVLAGCRDRQLVLSAAQTGRFLVNDLESDAAAVGAEQRRLQAAGVYGLASVELLDTPARLPFSENLVNVLLLGDQPAGDVPLAEAARVLCPGGVLLVAAGRAPAVALEAAGLAPVRSVKLGGQWWLARKPRPAQMDEWTHPRHAADGNPVSADTLVAPPRRIRWVAGPQQEKANMVTADGRCFYAGVFARDAFNGLRLWEKALTPSPARGGYNFTFLKGSVPPVAVGDRLLVVTDGKLLALDAATGDVAHEYHPPFLPSALACTQGMVLGSGATGAYALDLQSGSVRWSVPAEDVRCLVADDGAVFFLQGPAAATKLTSVEMATGKLRWERSGAPWLGKVRTLVAHGGVLACEVSTLSNDPKGNALYVLSAGDGKDLWGGEMTPYQVHYKQARAMFVGDALWMLREEQKRGRAVALDPRTGAVLRDLPAPGIAHCFPPIATLNYLFSGEMNFLDFATGKTDANRITKAACSRDAGVILANGLVYAAPKHCVCWPMLRDYCALAPARPANEPLPSLPDTPIAGPASLPAADAENPDTEWPCYRHDAWRSSSTAGRAPTNLRVLWTAKVGQRITGPIAGDWAYDYFIRGPVGPPVVAGGLVYVTCPDVHQVVALDARDGRVRWSFTANGRVDTAPTIYRGLCLFGSSSGWVYCLRADDGALVWRMRGAPTDERIVAYGQLESPWPVPGSVLATDGTVYFAAGRQALADGGIRVCAADARTGALRWSQRVESLPQTNYYGQHVPEFDNFDLLQREGDSVAMSRWVFSMADGKVSCDIHAAFTPVVMGHGGVMFPRGCWSYAPNNETEHSPERPFVRPLAVFRDRTLFTCPQDRESVFRRDFRLDADEKFDTAWDQNGKILWRSQRLVLGAKWTVKPFAPAPGKQQVAAMAMAANALFVVSAKGRLAAVSLEDGKTLSALDVPAPAWDGLALAEGKLFLTTEDGRVECLGARQ